MSVAPGPCYKKGMFGLEKIVFAGILFCLFVCLVVCFQEVTIFSAWKMDEEEGDKSGKACEIIPHV